MGGLEVPEKVKWGPLWENWMQSKESGCTIGPLQVIEQVSIPGGE